MLTNSLTASGRELISPFPNGFKCRKPTGAMSIERALTIAILVLLVLFVAQRVL